MDAEWIFFATSHGKSPCSGVGDLLNIMLQNVVYKDPYTHCPLNSNQKNGKKMTNCLVKNERKKKNEENVQKNPKKTL